MVHLRCLGLFMMMINSRKAIEYYLRGIEGDPEYQRLYFNVAITYYRTGKYAESEKYAVDAIKLDPKHSSSQRVYALATYAQHKRDARYWAGAAFYCSWNCSQLTRPKPTGTLKV